MFLSKKKQESHGSGFDGAINLNSFRGFQSVYNEFAPFVFSICRRYIEDRTECEDITSRIFVSLWERRDSIKIKESLKGYLYKATKLQVSDYFKLKHRRTERLQKAVDKLGLCDGVVENEIWYLDFKEQLENAVDALPPKRKEVFILIKLEGLSIKKVAQKLSLAETTVITHLYKAIAQLKELLSDFNPVVKSTGILIGFLPLF